MTTVLKLWKLVQPKPVNWDFVFDTMIEFAFGNLYRVVWNLVMFCFGAAFVLEFNPDVDMGIVFGVLFVFLLYLGTLLEWVSGQVTMAVKNNYGAERVIEIIDDLDKEDRDRVAGHLLSKFANSLDEVLHDRGAK